MCLTFLPNIQRFDGKCINFSNMAIGFLFVSLVVYVVFCIASFVLFDKDMFLFCKQSCRIRCSPGC